MTKEYILMPVAMANILVGFMAALAFALSQVGDSRDLLALLPFLPTGLLIGLLVALGVSVLDVLIYAGFLLYRHIRPRVTRSVANRADA